MKTRKQILDARWRAANKERIRESQRAWELRNPDRVRATKEKYRATHPLAVRLTRARYDTANAVRVREMKRAWAAANPIRARAQAQKRIARRRNAPGAGITASAWREMLHEAGGICAYCAAHATLTLDHIDPLVAGGAHDPSNAAMVCQHCNYSKNDTPLLVWLAKKAQLRASA